MFGNDTFFDAFAKAVEQRSAGLGEQQKGLIKAFSERRTAKLQSFPRRGDDLRARLRSCLADRAFVSLAAIAWAASAMEEWSSMVENRLEEGVEELAAIGKVIAQAQRPELEKLVTLVVPGGWGALCQDAEQDPVISRQTRSKIAMAADGHVKLQSSWLEQFQELAQRSTITPFTPPAPLNGAIPEQAAEKQLALVPPSIVEEKSAVEGSGECQVSGVLTSLEELIARSIPPRQTVFGTMIERRMVSLLAAAPGVGKTMLGIHIACAVALGKNWAGFEVPAPGPVVYLNAEDSDDEVARRFKAAHAVGLLDQEATKRISIIGREGFQSFMVKRSGDVESTPYGRWLRAVVENIRPALIIIDPMVMTHSLDENSNADMAALAGFFGSLATIGNAGVLVVHHAGKDAKAGLWAARGASSIASSVRSMWHLATASDTGAAELPVQLTCVKSNNYPTGSTQSFRRVQHTFKNGDMVGLLDPVGRAADRRHR